MGGSINGGTPNGWFIRENPIKMDDLGVPPFQETTICCQSIMSFLVKIEGSVTGIPSTINYLLINQWEKDIYVVNVNVNIDVSCGSWLMSMSMLICYVVNVNVNIDVSCG